MSHAGRGQRPRGEGQGRSPPEASRNKEFEELMTIMTT